MRGAGLFIGADICRDGAPDGALAGRIVNDLRRARVLISATGPAGHTLKIRPPLVFTRGDAEVFLDRLAGVLSAL